MVLTKRERMLAIATLLVIGGGGLYAAVIKPLSDWRQETEDEKLELEAQTQEAQSLFERRRLLEGKWKGLIVGMKSDADAESRIARALDEWSRQTMLTLSSMKPDRSVTDKGMNEITYVVAGRGTLEAVASFLYKVETSELPVKVTNLQLGSTSESGDNMSLQLRLSAIYLGGAQKTSESTSQQQPEANDEEQEL
jgi:type II secretory pathway pseudopilin PulG